MRSPLELRKLGLLCAGVLLMHQLPAKAAPVEIDATTIGAKGDGVTPNTIALQKAIDDCSTRGGGTLRLPAGRYLTSTLQLKDSVTLHLDQGAALVSATDPGRNIAPFTDGSGHADMGYAFVCALDAHDIGIEGAGEIDGRGNEVAAAQRTNGGAYNKRPFLVRLVRCQGVRIEGVRLLNAGAWTCHLANCQRVAVHCVTIHSTGLSNNDGIDIDASEDVEVKDCNIRSDDDSIVLKTTWDHPCRHIRVSGCTLDSSQSAIKCGTESVADFQDIHVSDCKILRARGGVHLFSVDGSHMSAVTVENITMQNVDTPIMLRLGARLHVFQPGKEANKEPGTMRDITIRHLQATTCTRIGILASGVPGHPIEGVTLEDIRIQLAGGNPATDAAATVPEAADKYPHAPIFGDHLPAYGAYLRHVSGWKISGLTVGLKKPTELPAVVCDDAANVRFEDVTAARDGGKPFVLQHCTGVTAPGLLSGGD